MKLEKLLKELIENSDLIQDLNAQKICISKSPYYSMFNTESEKSIDLQNIQLEKKNILDIRQSLVDNIKIEIEKEGNYISQGLKEINLQKIGYETSKI